VHHLGGDTERPSRIRFMSEHTDRLRKLRDRVLSAKEFL
jgi:hypothetical protein